MADYVVNPMVEYLHSLRTQADGSNPTWAFENRKAFLDGVRADWPAFPDEADLHVRTAVDSLVDQLHRSSTAIDLVFLTGDAGDGKTALCARIAGDDAIDDVS